MCHLNFFIYHSKLISPLALGVSAPARFALLRLPPDLARGQLPQQLFNLLASATHHVYGAVYQRTDALASYLSTTDTDPELAALLSKLLAQFIGALGVFLAL